MKTKRLIDKLNCDKMLSQAEFEELFSSFDENDREYAAAIAREIAREHFGNKIYIRGLIEFSNICKNNCYYCGLRASNKNLSRYRLTKDDILICTDEGYKLGFRTFVLQGGEDGYFTDDIFCDIIRSIKEKHPDCAVTLSLGERDYESYKKLRQAGADRYLLRHETADTEHYRKLHPSELSLENRIRCLYDLKSLGYQVGCGFMVGSPGASEKTLAKDFKFIHELAPQMIGIGPFLPHCDTPFRDEPKGDYKLTLFLLSLLRIMNPKVLLPATTALGTIEKSGREQGILAGANVVMPNLSPPSVRKKYMLYNNKICTDEEAAEGIERLSAQIKNIGYEIVTDKGDYNYD
jgi:biotin synthase